ncbi:hypothetical protein VNO77_33891 [Canavalia gladiata]|uniref:Uncharacterized protein n=1 Tax=Canavalia gladiata TaxID=3824 RepID=A0AAN9PWS6_CANGL
MPVRKEKGDSWSLLTSRIKSSAPMVTYDPSLARRRKSRTRLQNKHEGEHVIDRAPAWLTLYKSWVHVFAGLCSWSFSGQSLIGKHSGHIEQVLSTLHDVLTSLQVKASSNVTYVKYMQPLSMSLLSCG